MGIQINKKQFGKLALVIGLILVPLITAAQEVSFDESKLSDEGKKAYSTLRSVKLFAIGGVGPGGVISEGERALDSLIEDKKAVGVFRDLVRSATLEGGLFGLFALRMLNCDCFASELELFRLRLLDARDDDLNTAAGCFLSSAKGFEEKTRLLSSLMGKEFEQEAQLKECRRQTSGRPQESQKCYEKVVKTK